MLYNVMFAVHDLYVGECPPRSCIMKDQCTCPPAPGLGQVPLNSIKPSPPDICLYVINPTPPPPTILRELLICERTVGLVHLYSTYKATNPLYLTQFTPKKYN